jgi:hypothetical protein
LGQELPPPRDRFFCSQLVPAKSLEPRLRFSFAQPQTRFRSQGGQYFVGCLLVRTSLILALGRDHSQAGARLAHAPESAEQIRISMRGELPVILAGCLRVNVASDLAAELPAEDARLVRRTVKEQIELPCSS